jgi:hypothetical protein
MRHLTATAHAEGPAPVIRRPGRTGSGLFGSVPAPSAQPLGVGLLIGSFLLAVGMQLRWDPNTSETCHGRFRCW